MFLILRTCKYTCVCLFIALEYTFYTYCSATIFATHGQLPISLSRYLILSNSGLVFHGMDNLQFASLFTTLGNIFQSNSSYFLLTISLPPVEAVSKFRRSLILRMPLLVTSIYCLWWETQMVSWWNDAGLWRNRDLQSNSCSILYTPFMISNT